MACGIKDFDAVRGGLSEDMAASEPSARPPPGRYNDAVTTPTDRAFDLAAFPSPFRDDIVSMGPWRQVAGEEGFCAVVQTTNPALYAIYSLVGLAAWRSRYDIPDPFNNRVIVVMDGTAGPLFQFSHSLPTDSARGRVSRE